MIGLKDTDKSLMWDIGGNKVRALDLQYYTPDRGKNNYLYEAYIRYDSPDINKYNDLVSKLDNLYSRDNDFETSSPYEVKYKDKNGNTAKIVCITDFSSNIVYLDLIYKCDEINEFIRKENKRIENERKEEVKEEQRQLTPDL